LLGIEYEGIQPIPEEYKHELLEDVNTEDSKVDCEFSDVNVEEKTPLEEIDTRDDHAYADYQANKGQNTHRAM